jgi:hypothetical protein
MMRTSLIVCAILLIAIGILWSGQGAGWIGGSFMTGDRTWLVIGIVALVAGLALLGGALRRRA